MPITASLQQNANIAISRNKMSEPLSPQENGPIHNHLEPITHKRVIHVIMSIKGSLSISWHHLLRCFESRRRAWGGSDPQVPLLVQFHVPEYFNQDHHCKELPSTADRHVEEQRFSFHLQTIQLFPHCRKTAIFLPLTNPTIVPTP